MPSTEKRAERKATTDRKDALMAATLKCLSEEGYEGLSIRKICAEAGVSIGMINHHFLSKEDLIAQTFESLSHVGMDAIHAELNAAGDDARKQLSAFCQSFLAFEVLDPGLLRTWLVFWGMARPGNELQSIYERSYSGHRALLEGMFRQLAVDHGIPMLDIRLTATGLLALLNGLWIHGVMNQKAISREDALRLADAWVDALVQGNGGRIQPKTQGQLEKPV